LDDFELDSFELAIRELLLLGTRLLIGKLPLNTLIGPPIVNVKRAPQNRTTTALRRAQPPTLDQALTHARSLK
jgi:hypothetical protein